MTSHDSSKVYIETVCSQVKCRDVHEEIELELQSHFDDIVSECLAEGLSPEEANSRAIKRLGDPSTLGRQLHQSHKPRTEWGIIGSLAIFLIFGVLVMLSIGKSHSLHDWLAADLVGHKIASIGIGLVAGVGLFFWDYRKFSRYAGWLYGIVLSLSFVQLLGVSVNGRPMLGSAYYGYQINFISISPVLLLIALAGLFVRWDWNRKFAGTKVGLLLFAPLFVYVKGYSGFMTEVEYLAGFVVLMASAKAKKSQWLTVLLGTVIGAACLLVLNFHQYSERMTDWMHPFQNLQGSGYQLVQSITAIRNAGFWGQGFSSSLSMLPQVHTDFVFAYLTYTFGWVSGGAVVVLALYLIQRMLKAAQQIRDPFGRLIVKAVSVYVAIQFMWSILMCLGYVPPASASLPFIAYGGVQLLTQMISMGLVLSIYRRKDMIPATN